MHPHHGTIHFQLCSGLGVCPSKSSWTTLELLHAGGKKVSFQFFHEVSRQVVTASGTVVRTRTLMMNDRLTPFPPEYDRECVRSSVPPMS